MNLPGRPPTVGGADEPVDTAPQAAILDALPANIALLDRHGTIVAVNAAWREFSNDNAMRYPGCGVGASYLAVCDAATGDHACEAGPVADGIRAVIAGAQETFTLEYPCHAPTRQRWFLLTVTPLGALAPRGVVVLHLDISERRRAEQALHARDDQQRELTRQLETERARLLDAQRVGQVGMWETDVATGAVTWSLETHRIHGTDPAHFVPTHAAFLDRVHPDDRVRVDAAFIGSLNQREVSSIRHRLLLPDGTVRTVDEHWQASFDEAGNPVRVIGTCHDVSESERVASDLQEYKDRLSMATDAAQLGIWDWNPATGALMWDRQMYALYGVDERHACCNYAMWSERLHPDDRARAEADFAAGLAGTGRTDTEFRIVRPGGEVRDIQAYSLLKRDAEGRPTHLVGVNRDVTERNLAEAKIRRLSRVHALRSQISALIVRVDDRDELFREACRIAVDEGGFRMALIAIHDPATGTLLPAASAGKDAGLMADIHRVQSAPEIAQGTLLTRAWRDRKPVVSNHSGNDPRLVLAHHYASTGVQSLAALPLLVAGAAAGVLVLYSGTPDFFRDEELDLLVELADDIAFAIAHIGNRQRLDYLAYYDSLTGLANRHLFIDRADQCVRQASGAQRGVAMVLLDLERFKSFNDSLGHAAGDDLLNQVAIWLKAHVSDASLLARVGPDHFAMMLPDAHAPGDVARDLGRLIAAFHDHPFPLGATQFRVAAKFGVAVFPDDGADAESLFKNAESALKKAKRGGERYLFYTEKMSASVARELTLESQLRQALERDEFILHYQPKMNLRSGQLAGAEALIRWNDPLTGMVQPGVFVPILESTGLIYDVGRWALRRALQQYLRWRDAGLPAVRIAVNVSPLQLRHPGFVDDIRDLISIDPRAAEGLELEITEGMIMEDVVQSTASLATIRDLGLSIAIDDFGTGYSSLGYLSRLPVSSLKIDRSFIIEMSQTPDGLSLVSTMINLAHSMKLKVVAEGVETEGQASLLRLLKCDEMQGFLASRPIPGEDFEQRYLRPPAIG